MRFLLTNSPTHYNYKHLASAGYRCQAVPTPLKPSGCGPDVKRSISRKIQMLLLLRPPQGKLLLSQVLFKFRLFCYTQFACEAVGQATNSHCECDWIRVDCLAKQRWESAFLTSVRWLCFARLVFNQSGVEQQQIMLIVTSNFVLQFISVIQFHFDWFDWLIWQILVVMSTINASYAALWEGLWLVRYFF